MSFTILLDRNEWEEKIKNPTRLYMTPAKNHCTNSNVK